MSLDDLRVFLAVARYQGFTQASDQLSMPKASVSRAVARLENALGNRLLERSTRRLRLTEAGALLMEQTAPLTERLDELLRQSSARNLEPHGVLRIAAPYELGVFRLGDVLNAMLLQHPGLEAEIHLTSQTIDPRVEDYDIVFQIQASPLPNSNQVARRIYSVARGLYAAPSLLARLGEPHCPSDLAAWPGVLSPDEPVWQIMDQEGQIEEIRPSGPLRAPNVGMRLQGVIAGLGVGVLATHFCHQELKSGQIVPILSRYRIAPTQVYALLPGRRLMPAKVRVFLDTLAGALAPWDQGTDDLQELLAGQDKSMKE